MENRKRGIRRWGGKKKRVWWLLWRPEGRDSRVVSAITQCVGELDCAALRLIAVWAEKEQISNIDERGSHQNGGW